MKAEALLSHQVDILYNFNPDPICSATILSSYLIVTLASCLVNRSPLKITIQTQPEFTLKPNTNTNTNLNFNYDDEDYNDEHNANHNERKDNKTENHNTLGETKYIDKFYSIRAFGQNGSSESDLVVIALHKELRLSKRVQKVELFNPKNEYTHIHQPYKCVDSRNRNVDVQVKKTGFPNCMRNSNSSVFLADCISDTPPKTRNNFVCAAPLPGSGLFCEGEDGEIGRHFVLCGVLMSSGSDSNSNGPSNPVYSNLAQYLYGIFLPDDDKDYPEIEDTLTKDHGLDGVSIGGEKVDFNVTQIPYQLSLQLYEGGDWNHKCGASLIDQRTAITAAHCFDGKRSANKWRLVAGMRTLLGNDPTLQIRSVKKLICHTNWKPKSISTGFDIALIFANDTFTENKHVRRVWISAPDDPDLLNVTGTATGWGQTSNDVTKISPDLLTVDLPLLPLEECQGKNSFFKDSMMCSHTGRSGVCKGDSGGPLVLKNFTFRDNSQRDLLVGITSFGPKECEDLTKVSGFTKVSSYYPWIVSKWKTGNTNTNTTGTGQNKFVCFNGQEIDAEWRCDEEFDCDDGSDEKACNTVRISDDNRKNTRGCGEEIQLTDEHDIIYLVENPEPGNMSLCVWTIYNEKENQIELTLLANIDAHFDPKLNQLFALSNFNRQHFQYKSITRIGQTRTIEDTYTVLIFRGPSGIRDSGFHLRLKSVGRSQADNPLRFTRNVLNPTPTPQNYAYPSSGNYGVNERVFTVLPPLEKGGRILINLTFGGMEPQRDWFDIISIGKEPKSLFRLSEARKAMNETVEGGMDEIFLVFMNTASPAVKRRGIKFTYSEDHPTRTPAKEMPCGGHIRVDGSQNLFYQKNSSTPQSSCAWLISNEREGSSNITLLDSRSQVFNLTDGRSSLYILHNFTRQNSLSHHVAEFGRNYQVDQPYFVVYFRSSPFSTTSGFYLQLSHSNSNSNATASAAPSPHHVNLTALNQVQEFSYPSNRFQNSNSNSDSSSSQNALIVVQPTGDDRKVHMNLGQTHLTDENEEWAEIYTFRDGPISLFRTSGRRNMSDKTFFESEGEPLIVYLKSRSNSNNGREKKRLSFSYSEQVEDVKQTRSCGGVINLERRHVISYNATSAPGQRSRCLWLVHNVHGSHFNITAGFDAENGQLVMLQDQVSTRLTGNESVETESLVTALLFLSNGSANADADALKSQLHIKLNDVGGYRHGNGQTSLNAKTIVLRPRSSKVLIYKYPRQPAATYGNNERVFILLPPEQHINVGGPGNGNGNRIQLNLTHVDTESKFDRLEIYTYTAIKKELKLVFEYSGLGSWTNNIFLGEEDQPILLYFQSDNSTVQSGFRFKYTSIRPN